MLNKNAFHLTANATGFLIDAINAANLQLMKNVIYVITNSSPVSTIQLAAADYQNHKSFAPLATQTTITLKPNQTATVLCKQPYQGIYSIISISNGMQPPVAVTQAPTLTASPDIVFNGDITSLGDEASLTIFFQYKKPSDALWSNTPSITTLSLGSYTHTQTLIANTNYMYRFVALGDTNSGNDSYGSIMYFTTSAALDTTTFFDIIGGSDTATSIKLDNTSVPPIGQINSMVTSSMVYAYNPGASAKTKEFVQDAAENDWTMWKPRYKIIPKIIALASSSTAAQPAFTNFAAGAIVSGTKLWLDDSTQVAEVVVDTVTSVLTTPAITSNSMFVTDNPYAIATTIYGGDAYCVVAEFGGNKEFILYKWNIATKAWDEIHRYVFGMAVNSIQFYTDSSNNLHLLAAGNVSLATLDVNVSPPSILFSGTVVFSQAKTVKIQRGIGMSPNEVYAAVAFSAGTVKLYKLDASAVWQLINTYTLYANIDDMSIIYDGMNNRLLISVCQTDINTNKITMCYWNIATSTAAQMLSTPAEMYNNCTAALFNDSSDPTTIKIMVFGKDTTMGQPVAMLFRVPTSSASPLLYIEKSGYLPAYLPISDYLRSEAFVEPNGVASFIGADSVNGYNARFYLDTAQPIGSRIVQMNNSGNHAWNTGPNQFSTFTYPSSGTIYFVATCQLGNRVITKSINTPYYTYTVTAMHIDRIGTLPLANAPIWCGIAGQVFKSSIHAVAGSPVYVIDTLDSVARATNTLTVQCGTNSTATVGCRYASEYVEINPYEYIVEFQCDLF